MNNSTPARTRMLEVIAAIGLGVEALALGVAAIAYGIYIVFGESQETALLVAVGSLCLVLAVGVAASARGTWNSRRWARSLALTWQVFQAGLGVAVLSAWPAVGAVLIAVALAVAGCVLARASKDDATPSAELAAD